MKFPSWGDAGRHTHLATATWHVTIERQREKRAQTAAVREEKERDASSELVDTWASRAAMPLGHTAIKAEILAMADRRAALMMDIVAQGDAYAMSPCALVDWLNAKVKPLQGRRLRATRGASEAEQRRGLIGRATCANWWAKSLDKAVTTLREAHGRAAASVCARRQQYITDETMRRKMAQDEASAAMLVNTEIEAEDGDVINLGQAWQASVSNPANRRGEMMTRVRGCEEWAQAHGFVGIFTTHTTPSRFHAVHHKGDVNEKWIEAGKPTPKDGQLWLREQWQRARAALDRAGLGFFGLRVAEPHHDGTPHWHGLFFCRPEDSEAIARVMRAYWLSDAGEEPGAQERRFLVKAMKPGEASGYIAKYISKGIDDEGAVGLEGHDDEIQGRVVRMEQQDMFGGGARRVRAWASAHGIRQFQFLGTPPIGPWREMRRVSPEQAAQASERIQAMHKAVNRDGEHRADFGLYMVRQGGPMVGRDYRVALDTEEREQQGRYETVTAPRPVGVVDRIEGRRAASDRKEWRPRGTWGSRVGGCSGSAHGGTSHGMRRGADRAASHPWTRVNNCTGAGRLTTMGQRLRAAARASEPGEVNRGHHHARRFEDPEPSDHRRAGGPGHPEHLQDPVFPS